MRIDNPSLFEGSTFTNLVVARGTSFPVTSLDEGELFFRTDQDKLYVYDGIGWVDTTSAATLGATNQVNNTAKNGLTTATASIPLAIGADQVTSGEQLIFDDESIQARVWNGSAWVADELFLQPDGGAASFGGDVDVTSGDLAVSSGTLTVGTATNAANVHFKGTSVRIEEAAAGRYTDIFPPVSGDDARFSNTASSAGYQFENVNGDLVRIDSDGKLGVLTTSPARNLEVAAGSTTSNYIRLSNTSDTRYGEIYTDTNGVMQLLADADGNGASPNLRILISGTEAARFNPASFTVAADAETLLQMTKDTLSFTSHTDNAFPKLRLIDGNASTQYLEISTNNDDALIMADAGNVGGLSTLSLGVDGTVGFKMDSLRNVVVGPNSASLTPGVTLDVQGGGGFRVEGTTEGHVYIGNGTVQWDVLVDGDNDFTIENGSLPVFNIENTNNRLILGPDTGNQLAGSTDGLTVALDTTANAGIYVNNEGTGRAELSLESHGGQQRILFYDTGTLRGQIIGSNTNDQIDVYAAGTLSAAFRTSRVNVAGDLFVGSASEVPDGTLHVQTASAGPFVANANANDLVVEGSGIAGVSILSGTASSGVLYFGSQDDTDAGQVVYNHALDFLSLWAAGTEALRIDSSQNVGLGTTAPLAKLHIESASQNFTPDASADEVIIEGASPGLSFGMAGFGGTGTLAWGTSGNAKLNWIDANNNSQMRFGTGGSQRAFLAGGSLTVGTGNASGPLVSSSIIEGRQTSGNSGVSASSGSLANNERVAITAQEGTGNRTGEIGVYKHSAISNAAGYIELSEEDSTSQYLWVDNSGSLRISTTQSHIGTTNGTIVGGGGGGLADVVDDTTPQLGGNLDVNGNQIVSTSNGNINIQPNGTGNVVLGNYTFDGDQSVGAGQDDYVLTYNHTSGLISLEAASGGGGLSASVDETITGNWDFNNDTTEFTTIGIGQPANGFGWDRGLLISDTSFAPFLSASGGILLYSLSGELVVRDSSGNTTTLSPHNFSEVPGGPSEPLAWSYRSELGDDVINADMTRVVRKVEQLTGERLIHGVGVPLHDESSQGKVAELEAKIADLEARLVALENA